MFNHAKSSQNSNFNFTSPRLLLLFETFSLCLMRDIRSCFICSKIILHIPPPKFINALFFLFPSLSAPSFFQPAGYIVNTVLYQFQLSLLSIICSILAPYHFPTMRCRCVLTTTYNHATSAAALPLPPQNHHRGFRHGFIFSVVFGSMSGHPVSEIGRVMLPIADLRLFQRSHGSTVMYCQHIFAANNGFIQEHFCCSILAVAV